MLIAVDASGGEHAPSEIVKGALEAAQDYNVDIALVGRRVILHVLASRYSKKANLVCRRVTALSSRTVEGTTVHIRICFWIQTSNLNLAWRRQSQAGLAVCHGSHYNLITHR